MYDACRDWALTEPGSSIGGIEVGDRGKGIKVAGRCPVVPQCGYVAENLCHGGQDKGRLPVGQWIPPNGSQWQINGSTCMFNTNNCQKRDGSTLDDIRRPVRFRADARHGAVVCRAIDEFRMRCERPGLELRPRDGTPRPRGAFSY